MKILKTESTKRDELAEKLDEVQGNLATAIADYNVALELATAYAQKVALAPIQFVESERAVVAESVRVAADAHNDAVTAYNDAMAEAKEFVEEVASRLRDVYDGRSEKWQEGEKGQSADEFVSTWESFSPDEESELEGNVADEFERLPEPLEPDADEESVERWREAWEAFEPADAGDPAEEIADLLRDLPEASDE